MKVTYEKDKSTKYARLNKTEEFLPYDLGDLLIGALLEANLAEPLDGLDMSESEKQRNREVW